MHSAQAFTKQSEWFETGKYTLRTTAEGGCNEFGVRPLQHDDWLQVGKGIMNLS
jgi:hypothetical protein